MTPSVALIGLPGSGKSTVGGLVAERLGVPFVDVDRRIEAETGVTIADLFATHGETYFRELERVSTVAALAQPGVVSLGGGAPMTPAVADALRGHRHVVWLRVDPAEAAARVGGGSGRPLLAADDVRGRLDTLLAARSAIYADVAGASVDTTGRSAADVAEAVLALLDTPPAGTPRPATPAGPAGTSEAR